MATRWGSISFDEIVRLLSGNSSLRVILENRITTYAIESVFSLLAFEIFGICSWFVALSLLYQMNLVSQVRVLLEFRVCCLNNIP